MLTRHILKTSPSDYNVQNRSKLLVEKFQDFGQKRTKKDYENNRNFVRYGKFPLTF